MACFFKQPGVGSASTSDRVLWPASLQQLAVSFGHDFNQPIVGVESPNSLQRLAFLGGFNQRITGVAWPASLGSCGRPLWSIWFSGVNSTNPVVGVEWPASLRQLSFGDAFLPAYRRRGVAGHSASAIVRLSVQSTRCRSRATALPTAAELRSDIQSVLRGSYVARLSA